MRDARELPEGQRNETAENWRVQLAALSRDNEDLEALLSKVGIGALFVDNRGKIRRLTPIMRKHTDLLPTDKGRSVFGVHFMKEYPDLGEMVRRCLEKSCCEEREILRDGRAWRLLVCPWSGGEDSQDDVLVLLMDITEQKNIRRQMDSLINSSVAGIFRIKTDGVQVSVDYVSEQAEKITGCDREELQGFVSAKRYAGRFLSSRDRIALLEGFHTILGGEDQIQQEILLMRRDGREVWLELRGTVISREGQSTVVQYIVSDITDMKLAYLELEKERKKLSAVVEMSGDMIFEYDLEKDSMSYTRAGEGILYPEQITEHYAYKVSRIENPEERENGMKLCEALRSSEKEMRMEVRRVGADRRLHWVEITGRTIFNKDGKPERVLGKIRNIDEQKRKEALLRAKSQLDSLTGLMNQMTARLEIARRVEEYRPGREAYLIVCDIDDFKRVNDVNGHLFGDAVLCSFADEMTTLFPDAVKGRIGGDEFILFAENIGQTALEEKLVELNSAMTDRFRADRMGTSISCSLGVVRVNGSVRDYDRLFQWADSALYQVKSTGKGSYLIQDVDQDSGMPEKRYLAGVQKKDEYVREEALFHNEEDLILFCVELLENVEDVTSALKMIFDRTCRFFDLEDMVCVEHCGMRNRIVYQWSRLDKQAFAQVMEGREFYDWERIRQQADEENVWVVQEGQTPGMSTGHAKSAMVVFSGELKDYCGSMVFSDRKRAREWDKERDTLVRLSNLIFNRLRQLRAEKREQEELDFRLNYDELTGLPKYQRFISLAEKYLRESGSRGVYCVYIDFSNFRYFNEMYGYGEGDRVLRSFVRALQKDCRGGQFFSRVTSDNFVGFLRADSPQEAESYVRSFAGRFCMQANGRYELCNLVLAAGLYKVTGEEGTVSAILDCANEARKKCKKQKVYTEVTVFSEEIRKQSESSRNVIANMLTAYNNGEFQAYLQPKVSLKNGRIVGAEALARWIRPDGTIMMPDQFIGLFEHNGFITKLDFCILDQVLQYLQDALKAEEEVVPVSVNFSRRHNEFDGFVPGVLERLDSYIVPDSLLEVEITESVFLYDLNKLKGNLSALRARGVQVAIDDFGSGYSSLNVLTKVSADVIKLDKQFLNYTGEEPKAPEVVKYLVRMLKHLGYRVIAEGVETAGQVQMLKQADCDMAQGFYYARPMPLTDFRRFLREFNGR